MAKFLIATHGHLADGFKSSLRIVMGDEIANKITAFNCFVEGGSETGDVKSMLEKYFRDISEDEQVIVFTDILHGSVNQLLMPYADEQRVYIFTGINFPLMCEVMSVCGYTDSAIDIAVLRDALSKAQGELLFINDYIKKKENEENNSDDLFFE